MGVAVVGLVGVILGAFVSGVATDVVARRKQRATARGAARRIALELEIARNKLDSATGQDVKDTYWWGGVPSVRAWQAGFDALTNDAPDSLLRDVAAVYMSIENWIAERERASADPKHPGPRPDQLARLTRDVGAMVGPIEALNAFVVNPPGQFKRSASRVVAVVASLLVLLVAVALATALFVSRPNVNSATVSAAVEQMEGPSSVAECRDAGDGWSCSVLTLSSPRAQCLTSEIRGVSVADTEQTDAGRGCQAAAGVEQDTVENTGSQLLVFQTPEANENAGLHELLIGRTADPARSLFKQFWRYIKGENPTAP